MLQLEESSQEEHADAVRCQARLQHLQKLGGPAKDEVIDWNRKRLNRLLVDHLLHSGHYKSAEALSSESHIEVQFSYNAHACNNDLASTLHARSAKPDQLAVALLGNVQELVDLHVFAGARKVVADLRQHDCTAALVWCEEHKGRLKKGKNKLEFRLRMQVSFYKISILQTMVCILCLLKIAARCCG